MTSFSKLQPYIEDIRNDIDDFEAFYRNGLNYTIEDEERMLKQFAGNVVRSIMGLSETMTGEDMLAGEDERVEEGIALDFSLSRDKRDDRSTPEARACARADAERTMA